MSDFLPSPIINWQGGHCVPSAYSLAVLGTKNTHWWCYLCFKQNKMNRTKAVEVSHCNISIYVTNVESNYDIKKIWLDAGKHHARLAWEAKKIWASVTGAMSRCTHLPSNTISSLSPYLLATKHCPECFTFITSNPHCEPCKVSGFIFPFTDENTEAQISLISHASHDACLHQAVFFYVEVGFHICKINML